MGCTAGPLHLLLLWDTLSYMALALTSSQSLPVRSASLAAFTFYFSWDGAREETQVWDTCSTTEFHLMSHPGTLHVSCQSHAFWCSVPVFVTPRDTCSHEVCKCSRIWSLDLFFFFFLR